MRFRVLTTDDRNAPLLAKRGSTLVEEIEIIEDHFPSVTEVEHRLRWFGALEDHWRVVLVQEV